MELILTACLIIGGVFSVISLVSTCVREWAYRDVAGVDYTYGLWFMCVQQDCDWLPDAPGWLMAVRVLMIFGVVTIILGTSSLLLYKCIRKSSVGLVASGLYILASIFFLLAVSVYAGKESKEPEFHYMMFYNAFYLVMVTVFACLLGGLLSFFVVRQQMAVSKSEQCLEVQ